MTSLPPLSIQNAVILVFMYIIFDKMFLGIGMVKYVIMALFVWVGATQMGFLTQSGYENSGYSQDNDPWGQQQRGRPMQRGMSRKNPSFSFGRRRKKNGIF